MPGARLQADADIRALPARGFAQHERAGKRDQRARRRVRAVDEKRLRPALPEGDGTVDAGADAPGLSIVAVVVVGEKRRRLVAADTSPSTRLQVAHLLVEAVEVHRAAVAEDDVALVVEHVVRPAVQRTTRTLRGRTQLDVHTVVLIL